jgi:hypothetical protein
MKDFGLYLEEAYDQLVGSNIYDMQADEAMRWAAKSYVYYQASLHADVKADQISLFATGEEFRKEAVRLAAVIEDAEISDETLERVKAEISDLRDMAIESVYGSINNSDESVKDNPDNEEEEAGAQNEEAEANDTLEIEDVQEGSHVG